MNTMRYLIIIIINIICISCSAITLNCMPAGSLHWPDSVDYISLEVKACPSIKFIVTPQTITMSLNEGKQKTLRDSLFRYFILMECLKKGYNSNSDNIEDNDIYYINDAPQIEILIFDKKGIMKRYEFKNHLHSIDRSSPNDLEDDFASLISSYIYMSVLYFKSIDSNKRNIIEAKKLYNGADSVIVSFFNNDERIYNFHLKQTDSYLSSNDTKCYNININEFLPQFLTIKYSIVQTPFIENLTELANNNQLQNSSNILLIDIKTYKNGKIIRNDKYYKNGIVGNKRIHHNFDYFEFVGILKELINVYKLNIKYL